MAAGTTVLWQFALFAAAAGSDCGRKSGAECCANSTRPLTGHCFREQIMAQPYLRDITAKQLRAVLEYEPHTGLFIWRRRKKTDPFNSWAGLRAGAKRDLGYIVIRINYRLYRAHRLAWLYVHGRWPKGEVDHINGDPSDNRIANLRLATSGLQKSNARRRSDNTSGYKGVWWEKRRKHWVAEIRHKGQRHHLGAFVTAEDAYVARIEAANRLHGAFARHE